ncbi:MAG: hypothetical protein HY578_03405 [Nitrospinae bacterium]|nr:hypothetical protein [Nitrospinota bacterium]
MKNENWFAANLGDWKKIEERTREVLRLRHRSYIAEKTYIVLLCHTYLYATMIYTHMATKNILGAKSPPDK